MPDRTVNVSTQTAALQQLAKITQASSVSPIVIQAARSIVQACPARDQRCEIASIFEAVKYGTPAWKPLSTGVRYVNDPVFSDVFISPERLFAMWPDGGMSGDCDEHTALIVAMLSALGYHAGLRAWGDDSEDFTHVYAVVAYPKGADGSSQRVYGLDSTVPESTIGWEPPGGHVLTAWIHE